MHILNVKSIGPMQSDASAIDLSGYACLPGLLMDMHVHLTGNPKPQVDQFRNTLSLDAVDYAYSSIQLAERTLMAGFTTVRDLGAADGINVAMKRAIENGAIVGPRMFTAGKAIGTTGGHADPSNGLSLAMRRRKSQNSKLFFPYSPT